MRIGQLNQRITIEKRQAGEGPVGQPLNAWEPVATLWANVLHTSGAEAIKANADVSVVKASVRIRWRTDITAKMRVVHDGITYNIKAVLPDRVRRQHVDLVCEAIT